MLRRNARHILCTALLALGFTEAANGVEISDTLTSSSAERFAGFNYRAFRFVPTPGVKFQINMRSQTLDSYLILIRPDGSHVTNDDDPRRDDSQSRLDAGIEVDRPVAGAWIAIATTSRRAAEGNFRLVSDGIGRFDSLHPLEIDRAAIAAAFAARGVPDPRERIDALIEQLTLPSFRGELSKRLKSEIDQKDRSTKIARTQLRQEEDRERDLVKALQTIGERLRAPNDADTLKTVRQLIESQLKTASSSIDYRARSLMKDIGERAAFAAALVELRKLDEIATKLRQFEDTLLADAPPARIDDVRREISNLRAQQRSLGRLIGERLLDSHIVRSMRFGGFRLPFALADNFVRNPSAGLGIGPNRNGRFLFQDASAYPRGLNRCCELIASIGTPVADGPGSSAPAIDTSVWFRSLLPWPPPTPSSLETIGDRFLREGGGVPYTLDYVDRLLQTALRGVGYSGIQYWGVEGIPDAFAMVTPLEQTRANGTPLSEPDRWVQGIVEWKSFSLTEYLKVLFTAPYGYYRVLVFVISPKPFTVDLAKPRETLETIETWLTGGTDRLPDRVGRNEFTKQHRVTILVYEFVKRRENDRPQNNVPGTLRVPEHLTATKLTALLDR